MIGLQEIQDELLRCINNKEFKIYAESIAMKMVTSVFTDYGRTWREAARQNSKGKLIYKALKEELKGTVGLTVDNYIEYNAKLIKSIPNNVAKDVTRHIKKETFNGRRAEDIAKDLQKKIPQMFESKAKLIARTEVSKTSSALTQARSENIGIMWYIWRTCEDQRVRKSHAHMEGVLINWKDPPSPEALKNEKNVGYYNAGNIYNCRCYPEPIVKLNFITWPHKVYYNGRITTMTRKEFEKIM